MSLPETKRSQALIKIGQSLLAVYNAREWLSINKHSKAVTNQETSHPGPLPRPPVPVPRPRPCPLPPPPTPKPPPSTALWPQKLQIKRSLWIMRRSILKAGILKIAIPTDDGVHVSPRLWRASHFMIATVESGSFSILELENKSVREFRTSCQTWIQDDRYTAVANLLDCRVVISHPLGLPCNTLFRWSIDVIITSDIWWIASSPSSRWPS